MAADERTVDESYMRTLRRLTSSAGYGEVRGAAQWALSQLAAKDAEIERLRGAYADFTKRGWEVQDGLRSQVERLESKLKGLAFHTLHFSTPCNWDCNHLSTAKEFLASKVTGEKE